MARKWGNALGGYKLQNRKNGKFASGFAGKSISGSAKLTKANSTPGQRRAQYLEGKRKEAQRIKRKQTAKKVVKTAAVVGAVGVGAYAVSKSQAASDFKTGAMLGTMSPGEGFGRTRAPRQPMSFRQKVATVGVVSSTSAAVARDLKSIGPARQRGNRNSAPKVNGPIALGSGTLTGDRARERERKRAEAYARSTARNSRNAGIHTFTSGEENESNFHGGDYQESLEFARVQMGRRSKYAARSHSGGLADPFGSGHRAPVGAGPQGNKRVVNLSSGVTKGDMRVGNDRGMRGGASGTYTPSKRTRGREAVQARQEIAAKNAGLSPMIAQRVGKSTVYSRSGNLQKDSRGAYLAAPVRVSEGPNVNIPDPPKLTPGQLRKVNKRDGHWGKVPKAMSDYYEKHLPPVIEPSGHGSRTANDAAGRYGSADAFVVSAFGTNQDEFEAHAANFKKRGSSFQHKPKTNSQLESQVRKRTRSAESVIASGGTVRRISGKRVQ